MKKIKKILGKFFEGVCSFFEGVRDFLESLADFFTSCLPTMIAVATLIVATMAFIVSYFKIVGNEDASAFKQAAKALTVEEAEVALAEGLEVLEVNNYIDFKDDADVSFYEDVKTLHQQLATASQLKAEGKLSIAEEHVILDSTATSLTVREEKLNSVLTPDWVYCAVAITLIFVAILIVILVLARY